MHSVRCGNSIVIVPDKGDKVIDKTGVFEGYCEEVFIKNSEEYYRINDGNVSIPFKVGIFLRRKLKVKK